MALLHQDCLAIDHTTTNMLRKDIAQEYAQLVHDVLTSLCDYDVECGLPPITAVNYTLNQTELTPRIEKPVNTDFTSPTDHVSKEAQGPANCWMIAIFVATVMLVIFTCIIVLLVTMHHDRYTEC